MAVDDIPGGCILGFFELIVEIVADVILLRAGWKRGMLILLSVTAVCLGLAYIAT